MAELGRVIMRGESPLTQAQRELIAAYVSHLNECQYCFNGHAKMTETLGISRSIIDSVCADADKADIEDAFRPILHYVRKLTKTPHLMTQADAEAVYAAGWTERALHDAILVCCRFNFMNRLSLGHGLDPDAVSPAERAARMDYAQGGGHE